MKKLQEKYNLFTAIALCFVVYVVLSWFMPTATLSSSGVTEGAAAPVGLFSLFYYPTYALGNFIQFGLIILALGAFYGVIAKTGVYGNLVTKYANKYKGNEKTFLIVITALLFIASSVLGVPFALLIIVPFIVAILTKLGFNKITTLASTFGSILLGNVGSTFGQSVAGTSSILLGLKLSEGLVPRLIFMVVIMVLFILFIATNTQTKVEKEIVEETPKKNKKGHEEKVTTEVSKKQDVLFLENEEVKNKKDSSLFILLLTTLIIAILAMFNWNEIFGISFFEDIYERIIAITIGDYPIFKNILSLTVPFGYWDSYELIALLLIATIIIGWVYNLSIVDVIDGMKDGAKRLIKPAFYVTLANIVFALVMASTEAGNGNIAIYISSKLSTITEEFNFITPTLAGTLSSFFYNSYTQLFSYIGAVLSSGLESDLYVVMAFILQCTHSIMMMLLPTSLVLVTGLSMLDVKISHWLKYIGWLILQLIVIFLIILLIWILII